MKTERLNPRTSIHEWEAFGFVREARGRKYVRHVIRPDECNVPANDEVVRARNAAGEITEWTRLGGLRYTDNFLLSEFRCGCGNCREIRLSPLLPVALEALRARCARFLSHTRAPKADAPITITSAFRCNKHNKAIGGAKRSYHLDGWAADIQVAGIEPVAVAELAAHMMADSYPAFAGSARYVFGGVIHYPTFTHVDVREGKRYLRI